MDIDYSDETNTQVLEALNDDINHVEHNENDNLPDPNLDESEDNFNLQDFKRETTIDIADLKKKMFDIINTECIKIESDNEWSSRLLFSTLLQKITEDRQDLSVGVAYVSLLHLVNERGLKLFQDGEIINGRKDIYIARPLA
uniref:Condensin complex subunit 2 n=1 Tax=Sipha flava TaxID=143950 RepID=A0A2S2QKV4_9HEMI